MHVILFRSAEWPSWDVEFEPLVRDGMPVLVDFKTLAVSLLHAQHTEITRLRAALTPDQNVRLLAPSPEQL